MPTLQLALCLVTLPSTVYSPPSTGGGGGIGLLNEGLDVSCIRYK